MGATWDSLESRLEWTWDRDQSGEMGILGNEFGVSMGLKLKVCLTVRCRLGMVWYIRVLSCSKDIGGKARLGHPRTVHTHARAPATTRLLTLRY